MENDSRRIFVIGLLVVLAIVGFFFFAKLGTRLPLQASVLKERSIELNEKTSLLLLDIRIVNDSADPVPLNSITLTIDLADGASVTGRLLAKSDLLASFTYYPKLGEKFTDPLAVDDAIPPKSTSDWMLSASFDVPLDQLDARKKVTVRFTGKANAIAEFSRLK